MKVICDHSGVCSNMNCVLHLYEHEYRNTHSCELNYCRSMKCEVKCINVRKVKLEKLGKLVSSREVV